MQKDRLHCRKTFRLLQDALRKIGHQHNGHDDLIGGQPQQERQQNDTVQPHKPTERLERRRKAGKQCPAPDRDICQQPQQQAGRRRSRDRAPQYEQGAVTHRTHNDLPPLRFAVGWKLQCKGGRHPSQHGAGKQPCNAKGDQKPQQDQGCQPEGGKQRAAPAARRPYKKEEDKIDQCGKAPVAGNKAVGEDRQQAFPRGMNNAAAHHAGGVAAKAHADGERLLAACPAALEGVIKVVGDTRQVADVLQQSEQGEENRHGRQHDRDDPCRHPIDPQHQRIVQPQRSVQSQQGSA